MNIIKKNIKQTTKIARLLLFSMGIMLSCNVAAKLKIGDTGPGGGIIFHISDDGKSGLEAAQDDLNGGIGIRWYNGVYTDTYAVKSGINDGSFNTDRIIINQGGGAMLHSFAQIIMVADMVIGTCRQKMS